jgi:hypothetical protein
VPFETPQDELLPDHQRVVHHPPSGKYTSYRIDYEYAWRGQARLQILVTYKVASGERRIAGGFRCIEDVNRYIARFLPELL